MAALPALTQWSEIVFAHNEVCTAIASPLLDKPIFAHLLEVNSLGKNFVTKSKILYRQNYLIFFHFQCFQVGVRKHSGIQDVQRNWFHPYLNFPQATVQVYIVHTLAAAKLFDYF